MYNADYETTFAQVSPMKNGNRLVISLADYKMDDGRYTCQVQRIIWQKFLLALLN